VLIGLTTHLLISSTFPCFAARNKDLSEKETEPINLIHVYVVLFIYLTALHKK
jgi:hypothetical protein